MNRARTRCNHNRFARHRWLNRRESETLAAARKWRASGALKTGVTIAAGIGNRYNAGAAGQ